MTATVLRFGLRRQTLLIQELCAEGKTSKDKKGDLFEIALFKPVAVTY